MLTNQHRCGTIPRHLESAPRYRGVEQLEARRAHNPEVVGSSPASATRKDSHPSGWLSFLSATAELVLWPPGYETDERSSLGKRGARCRWQMQRPERSAAVDKIEDQRKPDDFTGHRKPARSDNPEVVGSSPASATIKTTAFAVVFLCF